MVTQQKCSKHSAIITLHMHKSTVLSRSVTRAKSSDHTTIGLTPVDHNHSVMYHQGQPQSCSILYKAPISHQEHHAQNPSQHSSSATPSPSITIASSVIMWSIT